MEVNVDFGGDAADLLEGLDGPEFVVRMHDRDEDRVVPNGLAKLVEIDQAITRDRNVRDGDALFFESLAGVKHGFVFDSRGNDVLRGSRGGDDAEDRVVVGLGAAAGKDNFLRAGVEERGHLIARGFDRGPGALAEGVDRGGVAKIGGEIGKHGLEDGGLDRGGGVVIEIDAVHGAARIRIEVREESV